MSEITIRFNLPEEAEESKIALNAPDYYSALYAIDNYCRDILKYGDPTDAEEKVLEKIRDMMPNLYE